MCGFAEDGAETDTGEDVHVVPLAWRAFNAIDGDGGEGGSRSENDAVVSPFHSLCVGALGLRARVGEREDDGFLIQRGHLADDRFREYAADCAQSDEGGGFYIVDDVSQGRELLSCIIVARKEHLMVGESVPPVGGDETARVDEPEHLLCFGLGDAVADEEAADLPGDAGGSGAGTHEDELVVAKRGGGAFEGTD